MTEPSITINIVLPAKNEARSLEELLPKLISRFGEKAIIVVDDGSTDQTPEVLESLGVRTVRHPYSKGNGAAIKSGARAANVDYIVFMDADGQHDPADIEPLIERLRSGYDMAVAARTRSSQASTARWLANSFYNHFSSWMTGHQIDDLTSGFRAVNAAKFKGFLYLLPNGFSYPTSSTMAFFRAGYSVCYVQTTMNQRLGESHVQPLRDGVRFLLIIFRVGSLFSPLKLFIPIALAFFVLGAGYYGWTFSTMGRFTNMSTLLFITSVLVFLIGLVSEQITALLYSTHLDNDDTGTGSS